MKPVFLSRTETSCTRSTHHIIFHHVASSLLTPTSLLLIAIPLHRTSVTHALVHKASAHCLCSGSVISLIRPPPPPPSVAMGKTLPSGSGLPACWNREMDRFICHCDALGTMDTKTAIRHLKRKYVVLANVSQILSFHQLCVGYRIKLWYFRSVRTGEARRALEIEDNDR